MAHICKSWREHGHRAADRPTTRSKWSSRPDQACGGYRCTCFPPRWAFQCEDREQMNSLGEAHCRETVEQVVDEDNHRALSTAANSSATSQHTAGGTNASLLGGTCRSD
jgi:hypothetical protein